MNRQDLDAAAVSRSAATERSRLLAMGLGAGDSIGWLALNDLRMLGLLQACSELGARLVPLNWRLAPAELAAIVRHAGLQVLLHDEAHAALARAVEALAPLPQPRASGHEAGDVLLVYTSGTTGEPKGAIHTRDGMRANVDAAIAGQRFVAATRTLAILPLFHVGGLCIQVLPTLAAGGRVRLHARFDPDAWFDDVAHWRPTTSLVVPAVMRALIDHPRWADADLSSLDFVSAGSSIVPVPLIEAFHARGVPVAQVYGATETGPVTLVLPPDEARAHVGAVGLPALGVQVRVEGGAVGRPSERTSPGEGNDQGEGPDQGELWVRAPNVARGYHRRPGDPAFADGWFRTGDLVRRRADGRYEVIGRSTELIISGGENILPAELEQIALADPTVAEAVAIGMPDARWGEVPVLALVAQPGATIDIDALRAALASRLARFKQPQRIEVLDALPKTALGKVARGVLRERLRSA